MHNHDATLSLTIALIHYLVHYRYHLPPQIQLPDVQLEITNGKALRVVVERLKTISPIGTTPCNTVCTVFASP